jgi:hypothetical protein
MYRTSSKPASRLHAKPHRGCYGQKNSPRLSRRGHPKDHQKHKGNDAETQANRSLEALQVFSSLTTQDLRQDLDIMHPAGRIKELRVRGFEIHTHWESYPTVSGKMHRMGRYVYMGKKGEAHE